MTFRFLIIALLITVITTGAVLSSIHSFRKRWQRTGAIILRTLSGILLILALLEPVITVHRLPEHHRTIPILIDASESMSLFGTDSVVAALRNTIAPFSRLPSPTARQPVFMLFGDTVRTPDKNGTYRATDRSSFFSAAAAHPLVRSSRDIVIISDANWSDTTPVPGPAESQAIWYLPLAPVRTDATITCTVPDSVVSSADTPFDVTIPCSGTARTTTTVNLYIINTRDTIATSTRSINAGPFHHSFTMRLPGAPAGLHCYRIIAVNRADTVRSSGFLLHHAVREAHTYTIHSSAPSLDERFLRSALIGRSDFSRAGSRKKNRSDCRFIFGSTQTPPASPKTLDVFLGTIPGASSAGDSILPNDQLLPGEFSGNPFSRLPLSDLPPVVIQQPGTGCTVITPWITALRNGDTLPVVFKGIYKKRMIISCAFPEFWQWDFLPLAHASGEAETFQFTRQLLDAVGATLLQLQTDTLLLYPTATPAANTPMPFTVIVPSAHIPHLETIIPSVAIRNDDGTLMLDTMLSMISTGSISHQTVLPPLVPGNYSAACSLAAGSRTFTAAIPFTVEKTNAELSVTTQNEQLLRTMGQPFSLDDSSFLATLFTGDSHIANREPAPEDIRIRRSWWMLILLLLLFGGEWLLRRVARLD